MTSVLGILKEAAGRVFTRPAYVLLASVFALLALFIAIWLPNLELLKIVLFTDTFSARSNAAILFASFWNIQTSFQAFARIVTLLVSALFGANMALLVWLLKRRYALGREAGASVFGTVLGLIGVGCASCGSVIAAALVGTAFVAMMPLRGLEFGLLGILVLMFSAYLTAKAIVRPAVCAMPDRPSGGS